MWGAKIKIVTASANATRKPAVDEMVIVLIGSGFFIVSVFDVLSFKVLKHIISGALRPDFKARFVRGSI